MITLLELELKYSKKLKLYWFMAERTKTWMQKKNWNELHNLFHVIVHVIYLKRDWMKRTLGQPRHLHNFVLKFRCSTTISPTVSLNSWLLPLCKCLCRRWTWCCRCLLSWTHTHCWSARSGHSSVNAFEFWHARSPSDEAAVDWLTTYGS